MKQNKEIISLNSIKDEFSKEMGIDERFKILSLSEQQRIVGGDDPTCPPMNDCPLMGATISCANEWFHCENNDCSWDGPGCLCDGYEPCPIDHYSTT